MLQGQVHFEARVAAPRLTFPKTTILSVLTGVSKIEVECESGDQIKSIAYVSAAQSIEEGLALAAQAIESVLNRLAFRHLVAIENAKVISREFSWIDPTSGKRILAEPGIYTITGNPATLLLGLTTSTLKEQLEESTIPGEINFGQFRSAQLSTGPVEEFMHLYSILLGLFNDQQERVDAFIVKTDPSVPQTQSPIKSKALETIYTRLRNEFAHKRAGVSLAATKSEMTQQLNDFRNIVKRAIEQHS